MNQDVNELIIENKKTIIEYKPRREPENLCPWCRVRYERRIRAKNPRPYTATIEYRELIIDWK